VAKLNIKINIAQTSDGRIERDAARERKKKTFTLQ